MNPTESCAPRTNQEKVIKYMQKLDTSKLCGLGLESTILKAVAKLKGQHSLQTNLVKSETATSTTKPPGTPEVDVQKDADRQLSINEQTLKIREVGAGTSTLIAKQTVQSETNEQFTEKSIEVVLLDDKEKSKGIPEFRRKVKPKVDITKLSKRSAKKEKPAPKSTVDQKKNTKKPETISASSRTSNLREEKSLPANQESDVEPCKRVSIKQTPKTSVEVIELDQINTENVEELKANNKVLIDDQNNTDVCEIKDEGHAKNVMTSSSNKPAMLFSPTRIEEQPITSKMGSTSQKPIEKATHKFFNIFTSNGMRLQSDNNKESEDPKACLNSGLDTDKKKIISPTNHLNSSTIVNVDKNTFDEVSNIPIENPVKENEKQENIIFDVQTKDLISKEPKIKTIDKDGNTKKGNHINNKIIEEDKTKTKKKQVVVKPSSGKDFHKSTSKSVKSQDDKNPNPSSFIEDIIEKKDIDSVVKESSNLETRISELNKVGEAVINSEKSVAGQLPANDSSTTQKDNLKVSIFSNDDSVTSAKDVSHNINEFGQNDSKRKSKTKPNPKRLPKKDKSTKSSTKPSIEKSDIEIEFSETEVKKLDQLELNESSGKVKSDTIQLDKDNRNFLENKGIENICLKLNTSEKNPLPIEISTNSSNEAIPVTNDLHETNLEEEEIYFEKLKKQKPKNVKTAKERKSTTNVTAKKNCHSSNNSDVDLPAKSVNTNMTESFSETDDEKFLGFEGTDIQQIDQEMQMFYSAIKKGHSKTAEKTSSIQFQNNDSGLRKFNDPPVKEPNDSNNEPPSEHFSLNHNISVVDNEENDMTVTSKEQEKVNVSVPKKRGRKPKIKVITPSTSTEDLSLSQVRDFGKQTTSNSTLREDTSIDSTPKPAPKKRGRKPKAKITDSAIIQNESTIDNSGLDEPTISTKRVRKSRLNASDFLKDDSPTPSVSSVESVEIQKERKKRGRKKNANKSLEDLNASKTSTPRRKINELPEDIEVTCGRCDAVMPNSDWYNHTFIHFGATWRKDIDPELDVNDIKKMTYRMHNFLTLHKIPGIKCDKCGIVKKSAGGYLVHIQMCGLDVENAKIACKHCNAKLLPLSLDAHLAQTCHVLKALAMEEKLKIKNLTDLNETIESEMSLSGNRVKRKSMIQAEKSFKKIKETEIDVNDYIKKRTAQGLHKMLNKTGELIKCQFCSFSCTEVKEFISHCGSNACPNNYRCAICRHVCRELDEMQNHVRSHNLKDQEANSSDSEMDITDDSSEECSSGVDEEDEHEHEKLPSLKFVGKNNTNTSSRVVKSVIDNYYNDYIRVRGNFYDEWTKEFRKDNFSTKPIFNDLLPLFLSMEASRFEEYAPQKKKSYCFADSKVNNYQHEFSKPEKTPSDWNQLEIFKGTSLKDSSVLYCGSVTALSWIPLPDSISNEFPEVLVAACRNKIQYTPLKGTASTKCSIQVYDVPGIASEKFSEPQIRYRFPYDEGPIWQMRCCPSGGFCEEKNRLGLIAVSSFFGRINIFSLPIDVGESKIIDLKPSLVLIPMMSKEPNQVCRIAWSQGSGHTRLAAGCANGLVLIWHINQTSPLLNQVIEGVKCILPTHSFFPTASPITVIDFHCTQSDRWLLVGSHDRKVRTYDLGEGSAIKEISTMEAKSRLIAGVWPTHWATLLTITDNLMLGKRSVLFVTQPLDIGFSTEEVFAYNDQCMTDIAHSDWLNVILMSTDAGDLHGGYQRNWLTHFALKSVRKHKTMLGYTGLAPLEVAPSKDSNEKQEMGIVFCDFPKPWIIEKGHQIKFRTVPLDQYELTCIRNVAFNPNRRSFNYFAYGYEAGLVRIKKVPPCPR